MSIEEYYRFYNLVVDEAAAGSHEIDMNDYIPPGPRAVNGHEP
jgi:hypothetical protein